MTMPNLNQILLILFMLFGIQCKANQDSLNTYPSEIVRLGLQHKYDVARWYMYCISCDRETNFRIATTLKESITFGTLPLKFDHLEIRNDTIEIDFYFSFNNMQVNATTEKDFSLWGVVFKKKYDRPITYSSWGEMRYYMKICRHHINSCPYREVNPLQPEVIKYIKQNREKLDPWFRKEALRHSVIK